MKKKDLYRPVFLDETEGYKEDKIDSMNQTDDEEKQYEEYESDQSEIRDS